MNNGAAIGYALIAARQFLTDKQLDELEARMIRAMDEYTEEEAEDVYHKNQSF
jgi:hypothetical protein